MSWLRSISICHNRRTKKYVRPLIFNYLSTYLPTYPFVYLSVYISSRKKLIGANRKTYPNVVIYIYTSFVLLIHDYDYIFLIAKSKSCLWSNGYYKSFSTFLFFLFFCLFCFCFFALAYIQTYTHVHIQSVLKSAFT